MHANHSTGEVGVTLGSMDVIFRPSLQAMTRIGSPADIIQAYADIMGPPSAAAYRAAIHVLACCADRPDLDVLLGYYCPDQGYRVGAMPLGEALTIARHMMRHGVSGVSPKGEEPKVKGEPMETFDADKFASMAIAHLGLDERAAWGMTMTGLIGALHSKFPPDKSKAASITEKQYSDSMDWLKRVNSKRNRVNTNG